MITLLKKYSLLLIASIIISYILTAFILYLKPDLLTTHNSYGATSSFGSAYLKEWIDDFINIIFVFLLYREMKTLKIMSVPILILTFFSSLTGVIFFLIMNAYNTLTKNERTH